jgi:hypothetical protein
MQQNCSEGSAVYARVLISGTIWLILPKWLLKNHTSRRVCFGYGYMWDVLMQWRNDFCVATTSLLKKCTVISRFYGIYVLCVLYCSRFYSCLLQLSVDWVNWLITDRSCKVIRSVELNNILVLKFFITERLTINRVKTSMSLACSCTLTHVPNSTA